MKDWKEICRKLLCPPIWLMILLTILSTVALVAIFLQGWETLPVAYVAYVLAFYTLTVVCIACIPSVPKWYRAVKQIIYANEYGNRYMTDAAFKTHVSLYTSLGINLLYVGMNVVSYFLYRSYWFVILAIYYTILAAMRFLLLRYVNRKGIGKERMGELKRSRACAIILMTLNFVLSGAVLMILYQNKGFQYNGILIYVMASYTFYITTMAVINFIKYRKYNSPVMSTAKVINLSAALVSMLSLETAMLSQFGAEMSSAHQRIMVAATGAGVSVIIIGLSVFLIVHATKEMKKECNSDGKQK